MTTDLPPAAPAAAGRTPWQAARDNAEQTGTWPEAWGPYHRHFASDAIHRDGGSECDQVGTSRRVYVFDPDALSAHEASVSEWGEQQHARQFAAAANLHQPYRLYQECDHDHTTDEVCDGETIETEDFTTCEDGYLYTVCRHCCTGGDRWQTEECASSHRHGPDIPHCPTAAILHGNQATTAARTAPGDDDLPVIRHLLGAYLVTVASGQLALTPAQLDSLASQVLLARMTGAPFDD